ncbi:hypothetical protein [Sphingomonas quercus]|uniref:Uncharacterized protein n=1 Tax=Sphingomonas quercus TaxID=2842451 RepID=A0ABS6BJE2_9SPHN|nr:hypothetical protein [Sphingomonas quercus]MBU3077936.1 hypothetical protein [Sphingomonas quercus]
MLMQRIGVPRLTPSEWSAVSIALGDATRPGAMPAEQGTLIGALRRLYGLITGNVPPTPLSDPRLETLRRFVFATRRSQRIAEQYVPELFAHGFSRAQVEAIALLSA